MAIEFGSMAMTALAATNSNQSNRPCAVGWHVPFLSEA